MSIPTASSSPATSPVNSFPVNSLLYGDNLRLLREHIPSGSIDLHYLDPPFNSKRNYFLLFKDRTGKASQAQEEAFTDTWNWDEQSLRWYNELVHGQENEALSVTVEALRRVLKETPMMAYLVAMAIRLVELHRTLKPTGSLYLHCDPTASHYLRVLGDVIFGPQNFRSEIIWKRTSAHSDAKVKWAGIADIILYYVKSRAAGFLPQYETHGAAYLEDFYRHDAGDGRGRYRLDNMSAPAGGGMAAINKATGKPNGWYLWKGYPPPERGWRYKLATMQKLDEEGRIHYPRLKDGQPDYSKRLALKRYLDENKGAIVGNVWTDIAPVQSKGESLGYPTQKPLALLERIISASTNPGDIVLDSFCGCGTAVDAAHKLGRRWIGMDVTAVAVDIIEDRMEQRYPELIGKIPVIGFPEDLESAQRMFEEDPYGFQEWACLKIGAHPRRNKAGGTKGADAGIDGWLSFEDRRGDGHRAVVQVKGGKVSVSQVRDFCHVVSREKATLGFFVCMGDAARPVTGPMREEALGMGLWTSAGGHEYPVVQILTVADIFEKKAVPRYPLQDKRSALGYKARKQEKDTGQLKLED